nr:MAG TPA: hypothetical protein [Caudoviricetes sp.]DAK68516.1 MAG TPA: hypothetical protein [Caudoviricetes sp.]
MAAQELDGKVRHICSTDTTEFKISHCIIFVNTESR